MTNFYAVTKCLLVATLVGIFATAASAASHHVAFNRDTKACSIARSAPTEIDQFSMIRIYGSQCDAKITMGDTARYSVPG